MKRTKRFLWWAGGVTLGLAAACLLAFELSPWPSVMLITKAFSTGDRASEDALAKHVPRGVVALKNQAYGTGPDELFDLYYRQGTEGARPTIVWVHGGGFIAGSKDGTANYLRILASHGFTTVAVEYSKGRGSKYPRPVEQVNAALGFLALRAGEYRIDPQALVLAGDSAGAQIASQVALIITDRGYAARMRITPRVRADQIAAILLLSGVYDLESLNLEGEHAWFIKTVLWAYSGERNHREVDRFPLFSVVRHVSAGFPPSFVSSGNGDPLAPQAIAMAEKLEKLGVRVETLFFPADREPALPHEYQFNLDEPAGAEALSRTLTFLGSILRTRSLTRASD